MDFSKLDGLIPAVIQDADSAEVLMVGFMNEEALRLTLDTGFATFFSRSRNKLWMKGETSGNRSSGTYTRAFATAGTFPYHCTIHGSATSGMRGTVTVAEGAAPGEDDDPPGGDGGDGGGGGGGYPDGGPVGY